MPWHVVENHSDCPSDEPFAVVKDSDSSVEGCHASRQEAEDQMAALYASEDDASSSASVEHFHALMVTEGESTGLRNYRGLTWREPPFAFHWEVSSAAHGGTMQVVHVGNVTRVEKIGDEIHGWGVIDLESANGLEYARKLVGGHIRWVSVGLDEQPVEMTVEYSEDAEDYPFATPEQVNMQGGRIGELTSVSVPALDSAIIEPLQPLIDAMSFDDEPMPVAAAATPAQKVPVQVMATEHSDGPAILRAADHILRIPDLPPVEWFDEPRDVDMAGAFTVTDEGRVYGYLAPAGVNHRSYLGQRVKAPMGRVDYTRYMSRETVCEGGTRVVTGPITMECGHAPTVNFVSSKPALEHYDNSCSLVATVRVGENRHGVWVAGALLPDVTAAQVARMMACALSGDWRPHGERRGWRELAGALLVPVPGFPMARSKASVRIEDGAMVASAVPVQYDGDLPDPSAEASEALMVAQQALAASMGFDPASRKKQLVAEILGE